MKNQLSTGAQRPFLSAPEPKRYLAIGPIEEVRLRVTRCIARHEGPALVIGAAGTGKTLALAVLAEQFVRSRSVVPLMGSQLCTKRALLQSILAELGQPYRGLDEGELRLALMRHVRGENGRPQRVLLLVDEADALPARLLEELRVLTNAAAEGLPLVAIVLAGSPALEERLADPQFECLSQRIAARCYLAPLSREETFQYVHSQVAAAGLSSPELFEADGLGAIHAATGGVPRLINQLGDQLCWMAEETGCTPLDASLVQQAWSDLQQLPAPWNAEAPSSERPAVEVVEFGELDSDETVMFVVDEPAPRGGRYVRRGDADDERPALIPIAAGRSRTASHDADELSARFEAAEVLVEQLEQMDAEPAEPPLADASAPAKPPTAPAPAKDAAATVRVDNPFDESFEEEEVLRDAYAGFACVPAQLPAAMLTAGVSPVARGEAGAATAAAATATGAATNATSVAAVSEAGDAILVVDDDDHRAAANIVPGRQLRRLFSMLETKG